MHRHGRLHRRCPATPACRPARRPPGRPNYFISTLELPNARHASTSSTSTGTASRCRRSPAPTSPIAATSWPNAAVANVPQPGTATLLDALQIRAMMQNQYTNFGGVESLWIPHTVRRGEHHRLRRAALVPGGRHRRHGGGQHPPGGDVGSGRRQRDAPLHAQPGRSIAPATWRSATAPPAATIFPSIKYAGRLAERSGQHLQPDRADAVRGNGLADHEQPLGRLQRHDARSRRLHVLVSPTSTPTRSPRPPTCAGRPASARSSTPSARRSGPGAPSTAP